MKAKVFRGLIPWALVSSEVPPNVTLNAGSAACYKGLIQGMETLP